jgi:hypothetical protein
MNDKNDIQTLRANFSSTGEDWQEMRELCKKHGITVHSFFTFLFNIGLDYLRQEDGFREKFEKYAEKQ